MEYQTEQHGDPDKILESNLERQKAEKKRALTTAITFGTIVILALVSLAYGFVQKKAADERVKAIQASYDSLSLRLEACAHEAHRQQQLAQQAAMHALEAQRRAEEALRKYEKK